MIVVNGKLIKRLLLAALIVCTIIFIWSNSLENSTESADKSETVIEIVKPIVDPRDEIDRNLFVTIVRKLAHFSEFTLLGAEMALLIFTFDKMKKSALPAILITVGITFPFAVIDELLQLTSDGRSCELLDMLIDLCGIICGVLFTTLVRKIVIHIRRKKKYSKAVGD